MRNKIKIAINNKIKYFVYHLVFYSIHSYMIINIKHRYLSTSYDVLTHKYNVYYDRCLHDCVVIHGL